MKTFKTLSHLVFCLAATTFVAGAYAQTILKFSHTDQTQGARQAAAQVFAKKVEEYTQGRYKVQVFCCSQLGNDPKNIEQVALGGIDFTVSGTGSYAGQVPSLNLTMMPFIIESYAQGWKFYDESKWLQTQFDKGPAKGLRFFRSCRFLRCIWLFNRVQWLVKKTQSTPSPPTSFLKWHRTSR
jgi:TRAP-type C4-dicarboxylate transport system substrate-binding protein